MEKRDDDPRTLKKKIEEQERQIANQQDLIALLTSNPRPRDEASAKEVPTPAQKTRASGSAKKRENGRGEVSLDAPSPPP